MSGDINEPTGHERGDVPGQTEAANRADLLAELRAAGEQQRAARRAALAELGGDREAWLAAIVDAYLESHDYNGLAVHEGFDKAQSEAVAGLIEEELVEIRTSEMSMNPHVRRLPTSMSPDEMAALVRRGDCERYVLYPTHRTLVGDARIDQLEDRPYEHRMAAGAAVLDIVYFDLAVLENYRNDPRYTFSYWDFGVQFHISDEAYLDPDEAERDKVSAAHVGIAYSVDTTPEGPIHRYLAVFVKDLADMTPEHQQRWRTYEAEREDVCPHPEWYRGQVLGHWPKTTGPFTTCLTELDHINQLSTLLWNEPLFETTDRPREWGWMIRGSRAAFREFAHLTDKLLADNLRHAGLDASGAPTEKDGNRLGTLKRLEGLLVALGVEEQLAYDAMGVWHEVNNVRHRQAHRLEEDAVDRGLLVAQVGVLRRLVNSLAGIRMTMARQPGAEEWEPHHDYEEFSLL